MLKQRVERMLSDLGLTPNLLGYEIITEALLMIAADPTYMHAICNRLYPELAARFHVTPSHVERNIRTAINKIWSCSSPETRAAYGGSSDRRPTNAVFLAVAAKKAARSVQPDALAQNLRRLSVQTKRLSEACLGCGFEHNCSVHGCQVMQQAADMIEELNRFHGSNLEHCLERLQRTERLLQASEAARTDLAKRLAAAQRELHETKSDVEPVHCDECIYIQDHKTYVACDKLNYGVDLSCGFCSAGRRRESV